MTKKVKIYTYETQKVKYDPEVAKKRRDQRKSKLTAEEKAEFLLKQKEAQERTIREHKGVQLNSFLSLQANFYLDNKLSLDKLKIVQDKIYARLYA